MKNIVIGALSIMLFLTGLLFIFTVHGRNVREQELNDGLNNAMKMAIEMMEEDRGYAPESNEEMISDFTQAFLMHINSASTVEIEILDVDYSIGLLSVRATSHYRHLTGTDGKVSLEKTIILEQYENEHAVHSFTISYFVDGVLYKEYELEEKTKHLVPQNVVSDSGMLKGWKAINGTGKDRVFSSGELQGMDVTEDVSYVAVFE